MKNNLVYQLPDSYAKPVRGREEETAVNNWRLFSLTEYRQDEFCEEAETVEKSLDLNSCAGYALDAVGEMYGCVREASEDDEAFRRKILLRISGMFRGVTVNEILTATKLICGTDSGDIYFKESGNATVSLNVKSPEIHEMLTLSDEELIALVKNLLPVGVGLEEEIRVHEDAEFLTKDGDSFITADENVLNARDW